MQDLQLYIVHLEPTTRKKVGQLLTGIAAGSVIECSSIDMFKEMLQLKDSVQPILAILQVAQASESIATAELPELEAKGPLGLILVSDVKVHPPQLKLNFEWDLICKGDLALDLPWRARHMIQRMQLREALQLAESRLSGFEKGARSGASAEPGAVADRYAIQAFLENEFRRCFRYDWSIALLAMQEDRSGMNKNMGPQLAACLHRPGDLLGITGNGNFLAVLSETEKSGAMHVAERILVANDPPTLSIGIAVAHPIELYRSQRKVGPTAITVLLAAADNALREALQRGNGQIKVATFEP